MHVLRILLSSSRATHSATMSKRQNASYSAQRIKLTLYSPPPPLIIAVTATISSSPIGPTYVHVYTLVTLPLLI
jgi:hypothetical protein